MSHSRRVGPRRQVLLTLALALAGGTAAASPSGDSAVANSAARENARGAVVLIGASYAQGWKVSSLAGRRVVNKGVGGQETHEVLGRFRRDVVELRPKAVLIWGFINDIHRSTPQELEAKLVRLRENVQSMVAAARKAGIVPIVATEVTLPRSDGWLDRLIAWANEWRGKRSYRDQVNDHVRQTNAWLRQLAMEQKLTVLDFEKVLSASDGSRKLEYATTDGTHLSDAAYDALTQYAQRQNLGI